MAITHILLRTPRAPFSKPAPGLGIDPRSPFARGLVHSYPFNEGRGIYVKNYAQPSGLYDLRFRDPTSSDAPIWGTYDKVNGLSLDIGLTNPLEQKYGNTGSTNPSVTGLRLLPAIDYTRGFTVHLWMRPTESLVGAVVAYSLLALGPVNEGAGITAHIHLTRFASGPTDYWRRNITIWSDGSTSANKTNSQEVWEAPFTGGRVKIDNLPYEHVISVNPNSPSGEIWWYSSDGYAFNFAGCGDITPPDNNQYWPVFNVSGQAPFEGNVWAVNVWNYPMGPGMAFALMRNPLQMYRARAIGGGFAFAVPPAVDPVPPPSGGGGTDDDDDSITSGQNCVDII